MPEAFLKRGDWFDRDAQTITTDGKRSRNPSPRGRPDPAFPRALLRPFPRRSIAEAGQIQFRDCYPTTFGRTKSEAGSRPSDPLVKPPFGSRLAALGSRRNCAIGVRDRSRQAAGGRREGNGGFSLSGLQSPYHLPPAASRPASARCPGAVEGRTRAAALFGAPSACPAAATGEPEPRRRDAKSLRAVTKRRRFASREPERAEGAGRRSRAAGGELRG
jgi:hypothetical protein